MRLNNRGNWTLIGLLVAVVIAAAAGVYYLNGTGTSTVKSDSQLLDSNSEKQTVVGKSMDTAKAADCRERLRQIRLGITNYRAMNATDTNPPDLKSIGLGVSSDYFQCPMSGQAYTYDQAAGTVQCPTHMEY